MGKLKESEYFNRTFLQGMLDRIATSHFKYGNMSESYPHDVDALKCMKKRLALYKATGNTEWLIDAANFLMIEFMYPAHRKAHFRPTDSHESPGLSQGKQRYDTNQLVDAIERFEKSRAKPAQRKLKPRR